MKKRYKYLLAVLGLLLVAGLTYWSKKKNKGVVRKVQIGKVVKRDILETVLASGKIQPEKEVKISSEVSGEIIELPVKEGQRVKKGDLLAKINPDIYQSAYKRAVAGLSNARSNMNQQYARLQKAREDYLRSKQLFEKGIISKMDFSQAKTNYDVAKAMYESAKFQVESALAGVKEAKDNLKRTTIYAPIDGIITRLAVEKGERVVGTKQMAGTEMMRIADLSRMETETDVNENDIVKVKIGDTALIEVEAFPGRKFKGVVTEIANSAEMKATATDEVVNFKVKIGILPGSYRDLVDRSKHVSPFRPGMTTSVEIITNQKKGILAVPLSAVTVRSGKKTKQKQEIVFVVENGTAKKRAVRTGIQDEEYIEIMEGLKEGERVVTGPYRMVTKILKDGDKVEPAEKNRRFKNFKEHKK